MFTHQLSKRLWLRWLYGLGLVIAYLSRVLFGTLPGALLSSFAAYEALPHLTTLQPWTFGQLFIWFDELDVQAKVGIASSLITVLGFYVALQTTMHSWQKQTAATMRMAAADSIDRAITEASSIILQMQVFAEALAREVTRVHIERLDPKAVPYLSQLAEDVVVFRSNRQRLHQVEQEILALPARHSILFLSIPFVPKSLQAIGECIGKVTEKVWLTMPSGGTDHPDHRRMLIDSIDPSKVANFADVCDVEHEKIASLHGGIRGVLLGPVLELNAMSFIRMAREMFHRPME